MTKYAEQTINVASDVLARWDNADFDPREYVKQNGRRWMIQFSRDDFMEIVDSEWP